MATATAELKNNDSPSEETTTTTDPTPGATPPAATIDTSTGGQKPKRNPLPLILATAILLGGGAYGFSYWSWSQTHVSTDDAYLVGNIVNISPRISGTLATLTVAEGDHVKAGQLLARLEDSSQESALRQAQAAYKSVAMQIPQAESNLQFQRASTEAAIARAQAAIQAQQARTQGAGAQVNLATATTRSQIAQAQSQVAQAQAQAAQISANIRTAEAQVNASRQAVQTASRGVGAVLARVSSAKADVYRATSDETRYAKLLQQEAVTQAQYDAIHAQAEAARSALAALNEQVAQARSQEAGARVAVSQAQATLVAARRAADAAQSQVSVARAGLDLARAGGLQVGVQESNLSATDVQNAQAQADLEAARAGNAQITLRKQQILSAQADLTRSAAALKTAQVNLRDTYLYAPSAGTVVRKTVNAGTSISAGQTILAMTEGDKLWITANMKETQLQNIRVGQTVEVDVDAFPDKKFKGVVATLNAATGASVSLLPPDNATGNFTKVVQRVPVKIALVPSTGGDKWATAEDFTRLRQGMSTVVVVDTADKQAHPERVPKNFDRLTNKGTVVVSARK
ncbi:MAG: HlyD family secretion protein [Akkermansiaceae bacterium]|nr:HlyD family secretion protein [Armatimonadota bacterium]